jgi:hypothetical protein
MMSELLFPKQQHLGGDTVLWKKIAESEDCSHVVVGDTQSGLAAALPFILVHGAHADGLSALNWILYLHYAPVMFLRK